MNFFLDTNIVVGYIFSVDKWHDYANKLFKKDEDFYWSLSVKNETIKIINKLVKGFNHVLNDILDNISNNFLTEDKFISFVEQIPSPIIYDKEISINKKIVAEYIWKKGGWTEKAELDNLIEIIKNIRKCFSLNTYFNLKDCENKLKYHIKMKVYTRLFKKLNSLRIANVKEHVHKSDNLILLDAHDLGSTGIDINFITADAKLLKFKKEILKITQIEDMSNIKDI